MKSFWKNSAAVSARLSAAPALLVTLDFDGTLAALAETPGRARLRPEYRNALRSLAASPGVSVFILSGRALESVRRLVGLRNVYYGGNHGIEIKGPGFSRRDALAAKARDLVAGTASEMRERFPPGTGVLVENKVFSASVHYRKLKAAYRKGFFSRMKAVMSAQRGLFYWRRGHKVFELVPRGAADKGGALKRLALRLGRPLVLAVGDDLTDEDMFRACGRTGVTVRVGRSRSSSAAYYLDRQSEVLGLLRLLRRLRRKK